MAHLVALWLTRVLVEEYRVMVKEYSSVQNNTRGSPTVKKTPPE